MTFQEYLWNDINHIKKMKELCDEYMKNLRDRWFNNEIDTDRVVDIYPSASHQRNLFTDRYYQLLLNVE